MFRILTIKGKGTAADASILCSNLTLADQEEKMVHGTVKNLEIEIRI